MFGQRKEVVPLIEKRVVGIVRLFIVSFLIITVSISLAEQPKKLMVVATIFPLTEIARAVAGERAEVSQIVPASADVHHFQLRPGDLRIMGRADLLLAVGERLEPWLARMEKSMGKGRIHSLKFMDYLESIGYPGLREDDPHIWLDLKADGLLAIKISEELSLLDPEGTEIYRKNSQELMAKIDSIDKQYRRLLSGCRQKYLVVAGHQAFAYLASSYGLTPISLTGANPEAQPGARRLQEIVNLMKSKQIKAIIYESSSSPAYARAIAEETGAEIYTLFTGVNLTRVHIEKNRTFLEIMEENLWTLIRALNCE
jgi:zinc transport system substrate-binding protein